MRLFAGIDGGQSSTTAVVGNEGGKVLGRGKGPPADEIAQDPSSTRLRDALQAALDDALRAANLPNDQQFEGIVAGVSGYDGTLRGVAPQFRALRFEIEHDAPVAHAAAFAAAPGVLVIAGTGSVAYGRNAAGETLRVGGWTYAFGDEGSAFWIARRCIERAMHDDDAGLHSFIAPAILKCFETASLREFVHAYHSGAISRTRMAAFAQRVLALARDGNADALESANQGADALAALAALCARRLHENKRVIGGRVPVAFSGGLLADGWFAGKVRARTVERLPEAEIIEMTRDPAEGALLLAIQRAQ